MPAISDSSLIRVESLADHWRRIIYSGWDEYSRHGEWIRLLFDICHDREIMKRVVDIHH